MTQLEKLKKLLGLPLDDDSKDFLLQFMIEDVEQTIKNYCHIDVIPHELDNMTLRMAVDLYRSENLGEEEKPLGSISSISEGDTTVSFKETNTATKKDDLLKDYKTILNKYRRLVW